MLDRALVWRAYEADDGASGGAGGSGTGAPAPGAAAAAPTAEPPTAPPPPQLDQQAYATLMVQNARLQARVQYPQADAAELDKLTDPAAIDAVARFSHEAAMAKQQAQQPTVGVPVPSANAATAAEGEHARKMRELQFKVRQRSSTRSGGPRTTLTPWEAEEALDEFFFPASWNGHMSHRRSGRGNVSDPPTGAPPAAPVPTLPAPGRAF